MDIGIHDMRVFYRPVSRIPYDEPYYYSDVGNYKHYKPGNSARDTYHMDIIELFLDMYPWCKYWCNTQ